MTFKKTHQPCPDCGSSDALCVNDDNSTKCFSCGIYHPATDLNDLESIIFDEATSVSTTTNKSISEPSNAVCRGFSDRRISVNTASTYGVTSSDDSRTHFPYYDKHGTKIAYKTRTSDKKFSTAGDIRGAGLFGQHLFSKGGKYVTIFEGEFDALAGYQMLGSKFPAVSIKNGAQGAVSDCKKEFEWLDSFDNIVICFDNDDPGIKAAQQVAELFGAKAKVFKGVSDYKDACDWLADRKESEFLTRWWAAEDYKPDGIVTVADIEQRLLEPPKPGIPWCFPTLTDLTYGRRRGELYAFGAGVGVGKTDVFTQQIAYDIDTLGIKVGVIYLEQNVVETAQRVMGKLDSRLYHIPDATWTREQYEDSIKRLKKRDQLYMFEHFGSMEWSVIRSIIRFFNKAYDIEHIYLDHLTALSANEQDERRALDAIMADMASLAQELGIVIHFISHLTTPDGKPHEEGGRVMEKHFTGSRAIARWSHYMFGLERNKQDEDMERRQITTFRVLKDRFTGRATGMKFGLRYNQNDGILSETVLIEEEL